MSDQDEYVKVQGKARHVRDAAVLFTPGEKVGGAWLPRSALHGADDIALRQRTAEINNNGNRGGTPMTLRIRRWKAEEAGFISDRDQQTDDLFQGDPK